MEVGLFFVSGEKERKNLYMYMCVCAFVPVGMYICYVVVEQVSTK